METLLKLYGPIHESLHVLALWLIGRRAVTWTNRYVDIPADLTTGQYVFVAGLPAMVFWGVAAVGLVLMVSGGGLVEIGGGMLLMLVGGLGGWGTVGDLQLIWEKIKGAE
jgi:hypothetical protein